ncbi:MAG: hypothetical protein Q4G05_03035 [Clostridia bacterium]|nr:hypothetical protein [Clostridia bacterium]
MDLIKEDIDKLKKIGDMEINEYLEKIIDYKLGEKIELDFYELLEDKSVEYLDKNYDRTDKSDIIEKVLDYIYDNQTKPKL